MQVQDIPLDYIAVRDDLRQRDDPGSDLGVLVSSITAFDLVEPIVVAQREGYYLLVAGERRLEAHRRAGRATIAAVVRDDLTTDDAVRLVAVAENLHRLPLTDLEAGRLGQWIAGLIREHGRGYVLDLLKVPDRGGRTDDLIASFLDMGRTKYRALAEALDYAEQPGWEWIGERLQAGASVHSVVGEIASKQAAEREAPLPEYRAPASADPLPADWLPREAMRQVGRLLSLVEAGAGGGEWSAPITVGGEDYRLRITLLPN